jgi:hypothetical protein
VLTLNAEPKRVRAGLYDGGGSLAAAKTAVVDQLVARPRNSRPEATVTRAQALWQRSAGAPNGRSIMRRPWRGGPNRTARMELPETSTLKASTRWSAGHGLDNARTDQRTVDAVGAKGTHPASAPTARPIMTLSLATWPPPLAGSARSDVPSVAPSCAGRRSGHDSELNHLLRCRRCGPSQSHLVAVTLLRSRVLHPRCRRHGCRPRA